MDASDKNLESLLIDINACWRRLQDFSADMTRLALNFSDTVPTFDREFKALGETIDQLSHDLRQGTDLGNYKPAFQHATEHIQETLAEEPYSVLDINILAVAASFSWDWIIDALLPALRKAPNAKCSLHMLLVDPDFPPFQKAGCTSKHTPWCDLSGRRVAEAQSLIDSLDSSLRSRFTFTIRYYSNLPHWHGVLIHDSFLLLGRASWVGKPPHAHFRVGENAYREYDRSSQSGVDRLDVFKNWFSYYTATGREAFSNAPGNG